MKIDKRTEAKIHRYYLAHQEKIDSVIEGGSLGKEAAFTYDVMSVRAKVGDTDKAIKKVMNSQSYVPYVERAKKQAIKNLRLDRRAYEQFRKLTRHQKIEWERVVYEGDNTYSYIQGNNRIYIRFDNSPVQIYIWQESLV